MKNEIKLFESNKIRSVWDKEKEEWYFSVVDIVGALTDSNNSRRYWSDLKRKIRDEEGGIKVYENIVQLKLKATIKNIEKIAKENNRENKKFYFEY